MHVGLAGAEEHAVRHDGGAAAAHLEHAQDEGDEEQLGLLGLDGAQDVGVHVLVVEAALEGRIGQDDVEGVLGALGELLGEALAQRVLVVDVGVVDAVQHQVHGGDAQHGGVEVEAVEHVRVRMCSRCSLQQVAGVDGVLLAIVSLHMLRPLVAGVLAQQVVIGLDQEAGGAAGRVADAVGRLGLQQLHHHADDVARGAELAVDAGGGELAEQVLVEVALGVASVSGRSSIMLTAFTSRVGFWIMSCASFMNAANWLPTPVLRSARRRKCGNTLSRTWGNISSAP